MTDWQKIIQSEAKQGYLNSSIFGGFAEGILDFIQTSNIENQAILKNLALAYSASNKKERKNILAKIELFFQTLELEVPKNIKQKQKIIISPLSNRITSLSGIGEKRAKLMANIGIKTINDLLNYYPRTYQDRGDIEPIADILPATNLTIQGRVEKVREMRPNAKLHILSVDISDNSGMITAVWFNQPHIVTNFRAGRLVNIFGKMEIRGRFNQFQVQDYFFVDNPNTERQKIIPIYALTDGINQKWLQKVIATTLDTHQKYLEEILPKNLVVENDLMDLPNAIKEIHLPKSMERLEMARTRLAYNELMLLQGTIYHSKTAKDERVGIGRIDDPSIIPNFTANLPFEFTDSQKKVIAEIFADMNTKEPMTRLLQGDVGSGKTIVAGIALYKNFLSKHLGAIMVPTEILAYQHFESLKPVLEPLGMRVEVFTGSLGLRERNALKMALDTGEIDCLIGTHTLIQEGVQLNNLGLVITDEQHRFGVMQRNAFRDKGNAPDVLIMSATPIPRTLALTLYGDIKVSVIDSLPAGRIPIDTFAVNFNYEERVFNFIKKQIAEGRQAYIICPLVDESENLDLTSATALFERLTKEDFRGYEIGLIHGKLKPKEKDEIMTNFSNGELQILISTTVIEVGINVPNANIILIRNSERFGLAQLHQLRGRVGRGAEKSYCILMTDSKSAVATERMKIMSNTTDGFVIAEADLKLRGSGDILGIRQSGLPMVKLVDLSKDIHLLEKSSRDIKIFYQEENWQNCALGQMIIDKIYSMLN